MGGLGEGVIDHWHKYWVSVCQYSSHAPYVLTLLFILSSLKQWQNKLFSTNLIPLPHRPCCHDVLPRRLRYNGSWWTCRNLCLDLHVMLCNTAFCIRTHVVEGNTCCESKFTKEFWFLIRCEGEGLISDFCCIPCDWIEKWCISTIFAILDRGMLFGNGCTYALLSFWQAWVIVELRGTNCWLGGWYQYASMSKGHFSEMSCVMYKYPSRLWGWLSDQQWFPPTLIKCNFVNYHFYTKLNRVNCFHQSVQYHIWITTYIRQQATNSVAIPGCCNLTGLREYS